MNKKHFSKIPFFRRCIIEQFPFIAEDFDAVTDYQLLCKVVQYLNMCIKNLNEQNTAVNELIDLFNELSEYVDNYLDNLDIQEAVNDKLEEMAQSGVLAELLNTLSIYNSQCLFMKNGFNGDPVKDGAPVTVSVINGFIDGYIQYYELKTYKDYHEFFKFEIGATAENVTGDGDMRRGARSMMDTQYTNDDTFIACNAGLSGWYILPGIGKVWSEYNPEERGQGWFYLYKEKNTGDIKWLECGNEHSGGEVNPDIMDWCFPIWSPVRINGINVCTDNFNTYESYENIVTQRHPRTLLCVNDDDSISIVIIPGRASYAPGATYAEMMLLPQKFKHIFNFDGGGSSVLLVNNVTMCPSWRYPADDWRKNVSVFKITPNREVM